MPIGNRTVPLCLCTKQTVFSLWGESGWFRLGYQTPAVPVWRRFYQLFMIMCFPFTDAPKKGATGFSSRRKPVRNWYRWVSFFPPGGLFFSGVATMWRWKTISKALNRCCNYPMHAGIRWVRCTLGDVAWRAGRPRDPLPMQTDQQTRWNRGWTALRLTTIDSEACARREWKMAFERTVGGTL